MIMQCFNYILSIWVLQPTLILPTQSDLYRFALAESSHSLVASMFGSDLAVVVL